MRIVIFYKPVLVHADLLALMRLLFRSTRDGSSCSYTNLRNKQNANSPGTYQTLCPGPRLRPKEYAPSQDPRSSSGAAIKVNVVYISCYDNVAVR